MARRFQLSDILAYDPATDPALVAYLTQICATFPKPEEALVEANGNGESGSEEIEMDVE